MMESSAHFSESVNQLNFLALWFLLWLSRPEFVLRGWLAGWLSSEHQSGEISSVCMPDELGSGVFLRGGLAFSFSFSGTGQYCVFLLISFRILVAS